MEREALGMIYNITKFRHYLLCRKFTFHFDHSVLLYLVSKHFRIYVVKLIELDEESADRISSRKYVAGRAKAIGNTQSEFLPTSRSIVSQRHRWNLAKVCSTIRKGSNITRITLWHCWRTLCWEYYCIENLEQWIVVANDFKGCTTIL